MRGFVSFGRFLLVAVVAVLATPAAADAKKPADFFISTCRNSIDDLAKVDALAQAQNWTTLDRGSAPDEPDLKLRSLWQAQTDGGTFAVMTAVGKGDVGKSVNMCMVMFVGTAVSGADFVKAISATSALKSVVDQTFPEGRMQMFEIAGAKGQMLQVFSLPDGNLIQVAIYGPQ